MKFVIECWEVSGFPFFSCRSSFFLSRHSPIRLIDIISFICSLITPFPSSLQPIDIPLPHAPHLSVSSSSASFPASSILLHSSYRPHLRHQHLSPSSDSVSRSLSLALPHLLRLLSIAFLSPSVSIRFSFPYKCVL